MKTAVFGGTFDPVHRGHINIARAAIEQFGLERLVIIPNAAPPHKSGASEDFVHRYNMLCLAFEDDFRVEISDYEADHTRPHYSLYTMRHFRELFGEDTGFIIGADSLCSIHKWYEADALLKENTFIVFARENDEALKEAYLRYESSGVRLCMADMLFYDASSTRVRQSLQKGIVPPELTEGVARYIKEHKLYGGKI